MSILKTHAIPLYFTAVSNTSRIVTWLTARYGKLSTIIKGDQRKKSLFRGQYDLFYTSELLFYDNRSKGIHIAKECSMLTRRAGFRTDWRSCASAGYIAALFAKTTLRNGHETGRFAFFEEMLSYAETYGHSLTFLIWFDLQFAQFQGQTIQLDGDYPEMENGEQRVEDGTKRWEKMTQSARFSAEHGGVIESAYAREHRIPAIPIARESLALLRKWQQAPTPKSVLETPCNSTHLTQIERVLERFVSWQFDLPPHVRKKAVETIRGLHQTPPD